MKLSVDEIESAKVWAQQYSGDDDPLDVFHQKLLSIGKVQLGKWKGASERELVRVEQEMTAIEDRFVLAPNPEEF